MSVNLANIKMAQILQGKLDEVTLDPQNFTNKLQAIREMTDAALECQIVTQDEWQALVTRSAKIQDQLNED